MIIQALHPSGTEHVKLITDDGQTILTTLGIVTELRLFAGKALEEAQLRLLQEKNAVAFARERALNLIALRPHSRKELRDKLLRKGTEPTAADSAVEWLTEHGYLDDASYAASVVRHYAKKGYGAKRITSELSRRGIDRDLWDDALDELPETDNEIDRFLRNRLKDPADPDEIRKVSAALSRRGFSWEEIRNALNRLSEFDE